MSVSGHTHTHLSPTPTYTHTHTHFCAGMVTHAFAPMVAHIQHIVNAYTDVHILYTLRFSQLTAV